MTDSAEPSPTVDRTKLEQEQHFYCQLGHCLHDNALQLQPNSVADSDVASMNVPDERAKNRGKEFFDSVRHRAHDILCGKNLDPKDVQRLDEAVARSRESVVATTTRLLAAYLGLAPTIANLVAELVIIFGYTTACDLSRDRTTEKTSASG